MYAIVIGTKFESLKIMETIHRTAQEPELALTFNYASNALNNAFFLSGLVRPSAQNCPRAVSHPPLHC
jgi:Fe-Mn family superoxide dismutase